MPCLVFSRKVALIDNATLPTSPALDADVTFSGGTLRAVELDAGASDSSPAARRSSSNYRTPKFNVGQIYSSVPAFDSRVAIAFGGESPFSSGTLMKTDPKSKKPQNTDRQKNQTNTVDLELKWSVCLCGFRKMCVNSTEHHYRENTELR